MSQEDDLLLFRTTSLRTVERFRKLLKLDTVAEPGEGGLVELYLVAPFTEGAEDLACLTATIFAEGFEAGKEDQKNVARQLMCEL